MFAHPARTWSRTMSWTLTGTPFGPSGAGPLPPPPCRCMPSHSPRTRMPARGRHSASITCNPCRGMPLLLSATQNVLGIMLAPAENTTDTSCTRAWLIDNRMLAAPPHAETLCFLVSAGMMSAGKCTYDERTLPLTQPLLLPAMLACRHDSAPLLMLLLWVTAWYTRGAAAGPGHDAPGRRLHEEPGRGAEAEAPRHEDRRAHAEVRDHAGRAHRRSSVAAKVDCLHGRCSHHAADRRTARPDLVEALKSSRRSDATAYRTRRETC